MAFNLGHGSGAPSVVFVDRICFLQEVAAILPTPKLEEFIEEGDDNIRCVMTVTAICCCRHCHFDCLALIPPNVGKPLSLAYSGCSRCTLPSQGWQESDSKFDSIVVSSALLQKHLAVVLVSESELVPLVLPLLLVLSLFPSPGVRGRRHLATNKSVFGLWKSQREGLVE